MPGGKLLRAKAKAREGRIAFVQVTGDFFMTPEGDLEKLEQMLLGASVEPHEVKEAVCSFFKEQCTVITGASPEDFAYVIVAALRS